MIDGNIGVDRDGGCGNGGCGNGGNGNGGNGNGGNGGNGVGYGDGDGGLGGLGGLGGRDAINRVSTGPEPATATQPQPTANPPKQQQPGGITGDKNPMLYDNLSRAIRWYKGRVAFEIHKINTGFAWQSRFHDHIIRDDKSFERITNYIKNNPAKWSDDKFYNA